MKARAKPGADLPTVTEAELDAAPRDRSMRPAAKFEKVTTRNAFEDARTRNVVGEHPTYKRGDRVKARVPEGECEILGEHAPGWILVGVETETGDVCVYPVPESLILRRVATAQPDRVDRDLPGPGLGVGDRNKLR